MSDLAKKLFAGLGNIVPDVKAELGRMGTQGTMELASALFNGHAFVPYGPGQYTPSVEHTAPEHQAQQPQHEQEHGIER
jgi:hypothetical protein